MLLYPLFYSVFLSFHRQSLYEMIPTFAGLAHYRELIASTEFWAAVMRNIVWTVGTVGLQMIVGIAAALLLNNKFKGRPFALTVILLPYFVPSISSCLVFRWMYNDINGLFNYILISLGIISSPILWLSNKSLVMFSVIMAGVWKFFPFVAINVLARLETIPQELYDAASIDGAGGVKSFFYITIPQIRGVLLVVLLLRWIFMFNKFDIIWIITQGGPAGATETLPILAYRTGMRAMRMGEAAAITSILLLILVTIMVIYQVIFKPARAEL
jgi:multiple sugar transport system permease protein